MAYLIIDVTISHVFFLKELKESFNYGLFYPPSNGRAGKFLDEERPLSDYPFNGPGGYLEVTFFFLTTKYQIRELKIIV